MNVTQLSPYQAAIALLCQRFGVARLELFGSAATGEFKPGVSDYDFLYELGPEVAVSPGRRLIDFAESMQALLGAHVELVNPRYIRNPYFAAEVNRTRVPVYASAPRKIECLAEANRPGSMNAGACLTMTIQP